MTDVRPELSRLQQEVDRLVRERGWNKRINSETFLMFTEEVGELAHEIRHQEGLHMDVTKQVNPDIRGELADILIYLLDLANRYDIDLYDAYRYKMDAAKTREWK